MDKQLILILKTYPKVSETFIMHEITQLIASGISPIIFSRMAPTDEPFNHKEADSHNLPVYYIPYSHPQGVDASYRLLYRCAHNYDYPKIRSLCVECYHRYKANKADYGIYCLYGALWILDHLDVTQITQYHIHSQFLDYPTEIAYYMNQISGVEYSISCHSKDLYTSPPENILRFVSCAKGIKTCTEYNAQYLRNLIGDKCPISMAYHGVNCEFFSRNSMIQSELRLLSVARMVRKKGYSFILKSLNMLKVRYPNFRYTIIGHGKLEDSIREQIHFLGLDNNVVIIQYAPQEVIRDYLMHTDIFINASVITHDGDRDGIPNSIAEAMSMEVPVVATDISGIPEIVRHLETGYLANMHDAGSLYNGLVYYIEFPDERKRIVRNARQFITEHFDSNKTFGRCLAFFGQMLKS